MSYGTSRRYKKTWLRLSQFILVTLLLIFCSIFFYQNAAGDHQHKAKTEEIDSTYVADDQTTNNLESPGTASRSSMDDSSESDFSEGDSSEAVTYEADTYEADTYEADSYEAGATAAGSLIDADQLVSRNALLVCLDDGKKLLDINGEDRIYPASMTKIMTAILAIENLNRLDQRIFLPNEVFNELYEEGASMAGYLPGEEVRAIDLLYGVLLPSGAECCIGLADYISGSEAAFVDLMNEKADALGMIQTHFANATGLHNPDHYTTAADLAILLEYALQNDTFTDIFTSGSYYADATELHPEGLTMYSTLFKNLEESGIQSSILGGKTGYTSEAGLCLASYAQINGKRYIMITANAKGNHSTEQYNIMDAVYAYQQLEQADQGSASVHR